MARTSIVARGGKIVAEAALGLIVGISAYPMIAGAEAKTSRETLNAAWQAVAPSRTV